MTRLMKFLNGKLGKEDEKLELLSAQEAYEQTADPQWKNYLREIKEAKEKGRQTCCLLCGKLELLREEHKNMLLDAGYDLSIGIYKDPSLEPKKCVCGVLLG